MRVLQAPSAFTSKYNSEGSLQGPCLCEPQLWGSSYLGAGTKPRAAHERRQLAQP